MAIAYTKETDCEIVEGVKTKNERIVNYKPVTKNFKFLSFLEALTLILVIAKLMGYTAMSWFWVFVPVMIHALIVIVFIVIIIAVIIVAAILS